MKNTFANKITLVNDLRNLALFFLGLLMLGMLSHTPLIPLLNSGIYFDLQTIAVIAMGCVYPGRLATKTVGVSCLLFSHTIVPKVAGQMILNQYTNITTVMNQHPDHWIALLVVCEYLRESKENKVAWHHAIAASLFIYFSAIMATFMFMYVWSHLRLLVQPLLKLLLSVA